MEIEIRNVEFASIGRLLKQNELRPQVIEEMKDGTTRHHYVVDCQKTTNRICQFDVFFKTPKKAGRPKGSGKPLKRSFSAGGPSDPSDG